MSIYQHNAYFTQSGGRNVPIPKRLWFYMVRASKLSGIVSDLEYYKCADDVLLAVKLEARLAHQASERFVRGYQRRVERRESRKAVDERRWAHG